MDVVVTTPCDDPPRNTSYPVTPTLSVDAVQVTVNPVGEIEPAAKSVGALGATVSAAVVTESG